MKFILALSAALLMCTAHAEDLKVTTLSEDGNHHPVPNVLIRLHYGCWHSMRPIELKQKTGPDGVATFKSVTLSPLEFCVSPDDTFEPQERGYLFTSPEDAKNFLTSAEEVRTTLPAEITFHVRRYTFWEWLRNFARYD